MPFEKALPVRKGEDVRSDALGVSRDGQLGGGCCPSRYSTGGVSRRSAPRRGGSLGLVAALKRVQASPESETPPAGVVPTEGAESRMQCCGSEGQESLLASLALGERPPVAHDRDADGMSELDEVERGA